MVKAQIPALWVALEDEIGQPLEQSSVFDTMVDEARSLDSF